MDYRTQSRELDDRILRVIAAWRDGGPALTLDAFNDLALRLFAYQVRFNGPFAQYCAALGFSEHVLPRSWEDVPPVPAVAYKESTIATFDVKRAELTFETSGTTQGVGGRHYLENSALYDAALLAGFERFMLCDGAALRYLNLVPNPRQHPRSSLGYMMARVSTRCGDGFTGWYLHGDQLLVEFLARDLSAAIAAGVPVCVAGTAFAFVTLCDAMRRRGQRFHLPDGSRVMETGGFKGRTRTVARAELYDGLSTLFDIPPDRIVAEYGMTELTSQWYDDVLARAQDDNAARVKRSPPWLRARVVGADGKSLPAGTIGSIVHVDLANRSSCIAVQTEDLGVALDDGLLLLGREAGAALRGCSLDAEVLRRA